MYMEMIMEQWWNITDGVKQQYWEKNLSQCHSANHKSSIEWPRIEPGPLQ